MFTRFTGLSPHEWQCIVYWASLRGSSAVQIPQAVKSIDAGIHSLLMLKKWLLFAQQAASGRADLSGLRDSLRTSAPLILIERHQQPIRQPNNSGGGCPIAPVPVVHVTSTWRVGL